MATTGASLQPIYERLNAAPTYHPLSADTFADWSMEAGDIIKVTRDDDTYESPVNNSTMTWKKGSKITVSSDGNEKRSPVSKVSRKKYNGGGSGLRNNEYQHIYVDTKYNEMRSGLYLTGSTAHLYVDSKYDQMRTGLKLTSSSAHLYVDSKYDNMASGLYLASSSLHAYVKSNYDNMKAGLKLSTSTATLYARNRTTKAEIIARINEDGHSEALIRGDRVTIDSNKTIKLNQVMTVINDAVGFNKPAIFFGNVDINSRGTLTTYKITLQGSTPVDLEALTVANAIKKAEVSGNVLTLTPFVGDPITFSKATTLSGAWGSGTNVYTVTAKQNDVTVGTNSVTPYVQPLSSQGGAYVDIYVATGKSTAPGYDTHGSATKLYLVQSGLTVNLKSENSTTTGTIYGTTTIPNATVSGSWSNNTWTATSTHGGSASVTPYVQPLSSQGGAYVDLYVATSKSASPGYDTHGNVTKLYLVKNGLTVDLKSANSSSSGTIYGTTTCSDSNLKAANIKNGVTIFGVTGSYSGSSGTIDITPDTVGHTDEPTGTRLWTNTTLLSGKWYKFTVTCGNATPKPYKILIP